MKTKIQNLAERKSTKTGKGPLHPAQREPKNNITDTSVDTDENAMLVDDEELDDDIIEFVDNENENDNDNDENPPAEIVSNKSSSKVSYVKGRMPQPAFQPNASPVSDTKRFFGM